MQSDLIPAKPTANLANKKVQLPDPQWHEVTISGWRISNDGQIVEFEVRDDNGLQNRVQFGLAPQALLSGELDRFIATVLCREPFRCEYFTRRQNYHMNFNTMVRKQVALLVIQIGRVTVVLDWESTSSKPAENATAPDMRNRRFKLQFP